MKGVNKITILGTLGKDPDVKATSGGSTICNISVATNEEWKDKNTGEKKDRTEWHKVVFFGKLAEIAGQYLKKGDKAYIEGKVQTRKWQNQEGQDVYTTEVIASDLVMLGGKPKHDGTVNDTQQFEPPTDEGFDDIPF